MIKELIVDATIDNVEKVTEFVDVELENINCPLKSKTQIDIAIDELFSNIAYYAYNPDIGKATIRFEVDESIPAVIVTFMDNGVPYNPLEKTDPDVNAKIDERAIGGLGIFMVKKSMDAIDYEYKDNKNILKIKKNLS